MRMKIIRDGIDKFSGLAEFHRELIRSGVNISPSGLFKASQGATGSIKCDVLCAIARLVYDGDWSRVGKALEIEFGTPLKGKRK